MCETITAPATIQDYIIDISAAAKKATTYAVVLENNTDFIIRRQTAKTEKELVILISQGIYYIRDGKDGSIDPVSHDSLRSFLRDMKDTSIELKKVHWLNSLCREAEERICKVIGNADLSDMCRHNIPIHIDDPFCNLKFWKQNKKLLIRMTQIFPLHSRFDAKYSACVPVVFWIEQRFGSNEAIYFAEKVAESGVQAFSFGGYGYQQDPMQFGDFKRIIDSEFNVNLRRFIDYICFDLYRQGYGKISCAFFQEYFDYLSMQKSLFGKIKEKYPEHFKTAHDVLALKVNLSKAAERCANFAQQAEAVKDLEYAASGYCIVVPKEPRELADEGINLSHCVGDYISRVASGECHILFLRRKATPEHSLVTLQLSGQRICQAQGRNRRNITTDERNFLNRWGQEKGIQIAV